VLITLGVSFVAQGPSLTERPVNGNAAVDALTSRQAMLSELPEHAAEIETIEEEQPR
jgi:hypothetical protein